MVNTDGLAPGASWLGMIDCMALPQVHGCLQPSVTVTTIRHLRRRRGRRTPRPTGRGREARVTGTAMDSCRPALSCTAFEVLVSAGYDTDRRD